MSARILVLEDDPEMLEVITDVLEDEDYLVDGCGSAEQALTLAAGHEYELMIADIRMKGMDGLGALTRVQTMQPDLGSMVITGYADDAQGQRAHRLGLEAVLEKPFELDVLLETVRERLAHRAERVARRQALESLNAGHRFLCSSLAGVLPSPPGLSLVELCERAGRLASHIDLEGHRGEELRIATLLEAVRRYLPEAAQRLPQPPEGVVALLKDRESLEGRAVELLLSSAEAEAPTGGEGHEPRLLRALKQVWKKAEEVDDAPQPRLFSLARTLLEAGDLSGARKAFQAVVDSDLNSADGLQSLLELARIQQRLGDPEQAQVLARRVPELADQVGPLSAAGAYREAALLLGELGDRRWPVKLLEQAQSLYSGLGLQAEAGCCGLAERSFSGESLGPEQVAWLNQLLQPAHRLLLSRSLGWLLPLLLAADSREIERPLGRLLVLYPDSIAQLLPTLDLNSRRRTLELLAGLGEKAPARVLEALKKDPDDALRGHAGRLLAAAIEAPAAIQLSVRVCGPFEVWVGHLRVPDSAWKTSKVRHLLAALSAAGRRGLTEERLIEQFWPDSGDKGRKSLHAATSYLRSALRSAVEGEPEFVVRTPFGLALDPALELWHDLWQLRELGARGQKAWEAGQREAAAAAYAQALQLLRGPYLEDCYMDWALHIRQETEQIQASAVLVSTEVALEAGRYTQVVELCQQALRLDPCLQEAHLRIMKAQLELGRPEEAVRQYELCKNALARELKLEPGIEVERLAVEARLLV